MKCKTCGQELPRKDEMEAYEARKKSRMERMDELWTMIEGLDLGTYSREYKTYCALLSEQSLDEMRMGL